MIQTPFTDPAVMAELVAKMLWEIKAVHFAADKPYKLSSGMMSPVYIDCRKLISFPEARAKIMNHALKMIGKAVNWNKIDVVAGGETAGILAMGEARRRAFAAAWGRFK